MLIVNLSAGGPYVIDHMMKISRAAKSIQLKEFKVHKKKRVIVEKTVDLSSKSSR